LRKLLERDADLAQGLAGLHEAAVQLERGRVCLVPVHDSEQRAVAHDHDVLVLKSLRQFSDNALREGQRRPRIKQVVRGVPFDVQLLGIWLEIGAPARGVYGLLSHGQ